MADRKLTFDGVCEYAEKLGCAHRQGVSKATNHAGRFFYNHWQRRTIMALYEAPKRTLKGKDKPEVCWWCIDSAGNISNVPARHLRTMDVVKGLAIWDVGYDKIIKVLNNIEEAE